jgi:predicted acyl esterase
MHARDTAWTYLWKESPEDRAEWEMHDQRFVDGRPDVLTYQTALLKEDVTITGELMAHLFGATTGSDADWVVKLIDVYPDVMETPHGRVRIHARGGSISRPIPK